MGFSTASYAEVDAFLSASATRAALTSDSRASLMVPTNPRRIWLRMTPELPRAPISEPWLIALHVSSMASPAPSSSATTASRVRAMFVPVSPSGTGYTFRRLIPFWWARMASLKVTTVRRISLAPSWSSTDTAETVPKRGFGR